MPLQADAEILLAFQEPGKKESAFTQLVRKYQQRLYWHIRRLVVTHEDANDVIQNVWIRVWKGLDGFRADSQLYTWLYRIATNESLSYLDQQKRKGAISLDQDGNANLSEQIRSDSYFDAEKAEWKLQLAIQQLPEKQRLVFTLRYFDEMPYEEMSRVLDTSEGALKASYHHAVKKVEDFLLNR
jgi:RNA polymerase sigma factor (sigma-70 family)